MKKNKKRASIIVVFVCLVSVGLVLFGRNVLAEQLPGTPDSLVDSKLKAIYDVYEGLGYGDEDAGAWGDWGRMWNRIRSSGEWVPNGAITPADVPLGKTFYNNSRTEQTGTAHIPNYSLFQYDDFDDYEKVHSGGVRGYQGEEGAWTNTSTNVWKDERTGLYWSHQIGTYTNEFPSDGGHSTCDFFTSDPRSIYNGGDSDCGAAINACATLSLDRDGDGTPETDWYLPTQKELMIAYVDGIYNQASGHVGTNQQWSSSERSDYPTYAWSVVLLNGFTYNVTKTTSCGVRCVSRGL